MAIPAFRASRVATGKSTKFLVEKPLGTEKGDYLLAIVRVTAEEKPSTPANWTLVTEGTSGSNNRVYLYEMIKWEESKGNSWTWEFGSERETSIEVAAVKEADRTSPRVGVSAFKVTALSTTIKTAAMTISAECLGLTLIASLLTTPTYTPSAEWTENKDEKGLWAGSHTKALTSNLTEQQVATGSSAATSYWVVTVGVKWGSSAETVEGKATISGTGAIAPKGTRIVSGKATIAGTGAVTAKSVRAVSGKATIAGTGSVTAKGGKTLSGKASIAGTGSVVAKGARVFSAHATVSGSGSITAKGTYQRATKATVSGTGGVISKGLLNALGKASIAGTGSISAQGFSPIPVLRGVGEWRVGPGTTPIKFVPSVEWEAGDLAFMVVETAGALPTEEAKEIYTPQTPEGWTRLFTKNNGNTRLTIFGQILTSGSEFLVTPAEAAIDHIQGQTIVVKKGSFLPVPLASAVVVGTGEVSTGKSVGCGSVSAGIKEALYLVVASGSLPDSTTITEFSSWLATNQEETITERGDHTTSEGDGGSLGIATTIQKNETNLSNATVATTTSAQHVGVVLAVKPNTSSVRFGNATISGTGAVAPKGTRVYEGKVTISGTGSITAAGIYWQVGKAAISGTGAISSKGLHEAPDKASVAGTGSITAKGLAIRLGRATISGTGTIISKGQAIRLGGAQIAGAGTIVAKGTVTRFGKASIAGHGTILAAASAVGNVFVMYEGVIHPVRFKLGTGQAISMTLK